VDFASYAARANDETAVIIQVEHIDAVDNIESILDVEGVDCLFVGPVDLGGSMGMAGNLDHPDMVSALRRFREACARRGAATGAYIVTPDKASIRAAVADGYTMLGLGVDSGFLYDGAKRALDVLKKE
jgi:2-keto-3-deoxy-L-rhamnonate aldolase RhmA